jgi:hypothetical protein
MNMRAASAMSDVAAKVVVVDDNVVNTDAGEERAPGLPSDPPRNNAVYKERSYWETRFER